MLEHQKAVVVGGSSGIGLSAAQELSDAGAEVWITGRSSDKVTAAAAAVGHRTIGRAVDANDPNEMRAFFAAVGAFDHLVVAVGGGSAIGAFKELDEAKMRAGFDNKFCRQSAARQSAFARPARAVVPNRSGRRGRWCKSRPASRIQRVG